MAATSTTLTSQISAPIQGLMVDLSRKTRVRRVVRWSCPLVEDWRGTCRAPSSKAVAAQMHVNSRRTATLENMWQLEGRVDETIPPPLLPSACARVKQPTYHAHPARSPPPFHSGCSQYIPLHTSTSTICNSTISHRTTT